MASNSQLIDGKTGEPVGYNPYAASTYAPNYATGGNHTLGTNYAAGGNYTAGGNYIGSAYGNSNNYVATTTSNYIPANTTIYGTGSGAVAKDYAVGAGYYASTAPATTTVTSRGQVVGTTVNTGKEVIKGESRIEYVPFEKKIIEYKDQSKIERVPKKVKKIEYRE